LIKKEELSGSSFLITGNGSLAVQNSSVAVSYLQPSILPGYEKLGFSIMMGNNCFIGDPEIRIGFEFSKQPFRCAEISNYAAVS